MVEPIQLAPSAPAAPAPSQAPATPPAEPTGQTGAPGQPTPDATPKPEPKSLHERVAGYKPAAKPAEAPVIDPFEVAGFNKNDLEKITDPNARQYVENLAKSFQSGFTKKFTEVAEEKRALEAAKEQLASQQPSGGPWTVERIQQEFMKPDFVQAAKAYATAIGSGNAGANGEKLTEEQESALTPAEKEQLRQAQQSIATLQQQLMDTKRSQEDEQLGERYATYDPKKVEALRQGLLSGNFRAGREHLWKVLDYEDAVARAYELGKSDERDGIKDKVQSSSPASSSVTSATTVPPKEKTESTVDYFRKIAMARLNQFRSQRQPQ